MRILDFSDGFISSVSPTIIHLPASQVSVTPTGNISSTDAQSALQELQGDIDTINTTLPNKVTAPVSTDTAVPRFNGTSGQIQNSGVTIDSSNNIIIPGNLTVHGTTTTIDSTNLDVTDKNITINKGGNDASSIGSGLTVDRTSTKGSIVFDSTLTSKWKAGLAASEIELADVSSSQTLTNKTLTSPAITTPTGIVKGDVGLGNVDNTSDATKNAAAVTLTNKIISGLTNTLSNIATSTLTGILQAAQFPALTGDVTTSSGALATTLATVNSNVGTFGSTSQVPTITVNAKGLITAVSTNSVTASSAWNVVSKSSAYTAAANDYIYASGSAFTITLPTAVGVSGQSIVIEHAGSNFVAYTINTTSSQTVGGLASGVFTVTTNAELLQITSDGSNWRISGRKTSTGRVSYTPSWGTGLGTPSNVSFFWERDREHIVITGSANAGTVAGSAASISGPSGATPAASISAKICGEWHRDQAAAEFGTMLLTASTAAIAMGVAGGAANPFTAANGNGILANTQLFNVYMRYPVAGWQP